ncbi:S8 family peptidase (plasmid) [Streptomyces atratus]|uniref:Subtilase family protein n=1 Tax=Streptomyces atratus TaxID=1893 RepID=A0A1K1ZVU3_STRAR|nr:S8 family serine peptidase [Streptomyces atratus]SFX78370.1 Subtilase family protein [Streptomyces atratus]
MNTGPSIPDPTGRKDADPQNTVYRVEQRNGMPYRAEVHALADVATSRHVEPEPKETDEPRPQRERDKVHPVLREWLDNRSANEREEVVVVLDDSVPIPRFPEPATDEPPESDRNRALLDQARDIISAIEQQRAAGYERFQAWLGEYGAEPVERFWLINGAVVDMPLASVERMAARDDVVSVEPRFSGEQPPQSPQVGDGRTSLASEPYFNSTTPPCNGGRIGLLDTGVRFSHTQFTNPSHVSFRGDCNNGGANCNTGTGLNPNDDCWNHGTSSAGIITANANQGNNLRGVSSITLDSYKVYATGNPCQGLDQAAAVRGFQAAVAALQPVIVAEMQGGGDHLSAIAQAADAAFNAGAVVIAANGNNGPNAGTVNCPANARRAIGVGCFDLQTGQQSNFQSRGPTADGRTKPDIQTPTNVTTASNTTDTATQVFGGTSCATPFAASAAGLLRNWLRGGTGTIDPGQVYASLILSGQSPSFNNTSGAGHVRLPWGGLQTFGKMAIAHHATIDLDFGTISSAAPFIDAAIWWPDGSVHSDIDVALVDPSGVVRASSISISSVFERCRATTPIAAGVWKVRITGYNVPSGPQTVYVSAYTPGV